MRHWKIALREAIEKFGGQGSGNFGHAGRPGEIGGSAPGSGGESGVANHAPKTAAGNARRKINSDDELKKYTGFFDYEDPKVQDWINKSDRDELLGWAKTMWSLYHNQEDKPL